MRENFLRSSLLKLCLFATGLSGIVAEYVLSTLATYFLGNSVFQWTMIVSIMLFSMGLGSRFSKLFENNLLRTFISIEFILSILVAFVSIITYSAAAWSDFSAEIIYSLSVIIGILIGMEIPLVIRINEQFEELKINVSSVMENDYYGSLLGGIFFAFIGLPYFGITHTPFILGSINFSVALILIISLWNSMDKPLKKLLAYSTSLVGIVLIIGTLTASLIIDQTEQKRYKDQIIYTKQSRYQKIVMTQSGSEYWLFINGNQQLSTVDEAEYHEAITHPALMMHPHPTDVLIMGGGDGCVAREVLKHPVVKNVTLADLDPAMTDLGQNHPIMTQINHNSLNNKKVTVINQDAFTFLENNTSFYDVIIVDLPDPKSVDIGRIYSREFYQVCNNHLRNKGIVITQAGSPFFAEKAFYCIEKTMREGGFKTIPLHHYLKTLGEWGWVLGQKNVKQQDLKNDLLNLSFKRIDTKWINNDAMQMMMSFGKPQTDTTSIEINTLNHPVLHKYYLNGRWDLY